MDWPGQPPRQRAKGVACRRQIADEAYPLVASRSPGARRRRVTRVERVSTDRGYCTIHLCQRKYCLRRHGLSKSSAIGLRAKSQGASGEKIPRSERQRLARFIRQSRDAPIRKSGVSYHSVRTDEGVIDMTPIELTLYRRMTGA